MSPILSIPGGPLLYSISFDEKKRYLHLYQVSPVQMKQINFYIPKNSNRFGSSCELELVAIDLAADRIYSKVMYPE